MTDMSVETACVATPEVEHRANRALAHSPICDLRSLRVAAEGDSLMLSGRVASFYHKQVAQEAVRAVASGVRLVNAVAVE